jgi:hypothetical protein
MAAVYRRVVGLSIGRIGLQGCCKVNRASTEARSALPQESREAATRIRHIAHAAPQEQSQQQNPRGKQALYLRICPLNLPCRFDMIESNITPAILIGRLWRRRRVEPFFGLPVRILVR